MLPLHLFDVLNLITTYIPVLVYDAVGLFVFDWGHQFYIECIETIIIIVLMCLMTLIEFKTGKILDYEPLGQDDEFAGLTPEEVKRRL